MRAELSRYTPEIVAFQQSTGAAAVYCFVLDGRKGSGGQPMLSMLDGEGKALPRELYLARCRELIAMMRGSADLLEQNIGDRPAPAPSWPALDGTEGSLVMFTVYESPRDFPGAWVVRRSFVLPGGETVNDVVPRIAGDLEGARACVPPGLYRQPRQESDDPVIVEVWF